MSRILITGSSDGLGLMAGQLLAEQGHNVTLHARNGERARTARKRLSNAEAVIEGDVSTIGGARSVAEQANALGTFDAVIHNVGIGYREPRRVETMDGLPHVFAINVIAPYILTALINRPKRLVYMSSGLHHHVEAHLEDVLWKERGWSGIDAYSESKLHDVILAFAVARKYPDVLSNALEPGWVATRMGGAGAPDDLDQAHRTQTWLAASEDRAAKVSGQYFYHMAPLSPNPLANDIALQEQLLEVCRGLTGISLPD